MPLAVEWVGEMEKGGPFGPPFEVWKMGRLAILPMVRSQLFDQLWDGSKEVGDKAVIGDLEDRRLFVLVDRHDDL